MTNAKIEKIQGKYGAFDALVIYGETLPIMNQLKNLGFRWYGAKKSWWISNKSVNQDIISQLKNLGVSFDGEKLTNIPISPDKPTKPAEVTKKQWVTEDEDMTRWYGFPINKAILSYKEKINVDNKEYDIDVTVDRSYVMGGDAYKKTKSREYKGKPKYLINVSIPELNYKKSWKKISKQLWGSYDEEDFLNTEVKDVVKNDILEKSIPNSIRYINDLAARTPEYRQFLNDIGGRKIFPEFNLHIEDPEYKGDYKILVDYVGVEEKAMYVYLKTNLKVEGAPYPKTLSYQSPIDHTFTVEDFYRKIQENIDKEYDKIKGNYIEYLKSFPYLASQKQEASSSLEEMKSILHSPQSYVNKVFEELKNRGYIRPSKRQKQYSGLTMGDEIKWVIDSKKIVDDAYGRSSYLSNTPEFFYSVVAYYIHRTARNISSWTDMMLVESMRTWRDSMKSYGIDISLREIERVVALIGSAVYRLFSKDVEREAPQSSSTTGVLKEFSDFALKHGISIEGLEDNVRNIYRSLAKNLHPDTVQDPIEKQEKTKAFQELQNIYDNLPQEYKTANNWYDRYVESQIQKDIIVNSMRRQK